MSFSREQIARAWARLRAGHGTPPTNAESPHRHRRAATCSLLVALLLATAGLPIAAIAPAPARADESMDGLTRITLTPGASEARFIMQVQTIGQPPRPATCTTRDLTGQLVLSPGGDILPDLSQVTIDQRSLKCTAPLRDDMTQQILETAQYPTAAFVPRSMPGLAVPLVPGSQSFQMIGDQTVRNVSRSVTYDSSGTSTPETFDGTSRTLLKMSDFGIKPPSLGPLLSVADEMVAEIDIRATIGATAAP
jgi:polyisoprenoid-binding protein YceI